MMMQPADPFKGWPRKIEQAADLPEVFRNRFDSFVDTFKKFPLTIFIPRQTAFPFRVIPEKLIMSDHGKLFVFEKLRDGIAVSAFEPEDVLLIEKGRVLLHSWLKFFAITDGSVVTKKIEFNSVMDSLFEAVITERKGEDDADCIDAGAEKKKFDYLASVNFKLMNFSRDSIACGEKVEKIVYQPSIDFWSYNIIKRVANPVIFILTNRELMIIRDSSTRYKTDLRYGGIFIHIPRANIRKVSIERDSKHIDRLTLKILLNHDFMLAFAVSESNKGAAEELAAFVSRP
jgi:hypothetical protein